MPVCDKCLFDKQKCVRVCVAHWTLTSSEIHSQVIHLISEGILGTYLKRHDPQAHKIQTDKALFSYTQDLKRTFLKSSVPLSKICFDARLHAIHHALGTHTQIARVQGKKLKSKREIRIDARFKKAPLSLLKMIVVHELAHLRERDHNKAFYQLCEHNVDSKCNSGRGKLRQHR